MAAGYDLRVITLEEFEEHARAAFAAIPREFREHVDGPFVAPEVNAHDYVPGTYVLGECHHHPDWTGDSPLHSSVVLYFGSFSAVARRDPSFDLVDEIRETVLHEVQHHLEDAVGEARLRDLDWAEDQNGRRHEGLPHQAGFWRGGEAYGSGLFGVGDDLFLEAHLRPAAWRAALRHGVEFVVAGVPIRVRAEDIPPDGGSVIHDWDWDDAPRLRDEHGDHAHGRTEGWGQLVVDIRPRRTGPLGAPRQGRSTP